MALRNQPYLPLYIQDILTDEKLILCSAEAHGVYLRLLCLLHKQEKYGLLYLKQKHKQNKSKYINFAALLSKQMPFEQKQIEKCLVELSDEDVIQITDNELSQKRMIKDGELSLVRAEVGKMGGSSVTKQYGKSGFLYWMGDYENKNKIGISVSPQNRLYRLRSDLKLKNFDIQDYFKVKDMGKAEDFAHKFFTGLLDGEWVRLNHNEMKEKFALLKAKEIANTENENVNEDININNIKKDKFQKPTLEEITTYCLERQNKINPQVFIDYYTSNGWRVGKNPMKDWKAAVRTWEKNNFEGSNGNGTNQRGYKRNQERELPPDIAEAADARARKWLDAKNKAAAGKTG